MVHLLFHPHRTAEPHPNHLNEEFFVLLVSSSPPQYVLLPASDHHLALPGPLTSLNSVSPASAIKAASFHRNATGRRVQAGRRFTSIDTTGKYLLNYLCCLLLTTVQPKTTMTVPSSTMPSTHRFASPKCRRITSSLYFEARPGQQKVEGYSCSLVHSRQAYAIHGDIFELS